MGGTARTVTYAYDPRGNRTRVTHPDGNYFEYAYEANDNPRFVYENGPGAEVMSYISDAFGRRERIERNANAGSITAIGFEGISVNGC
jgi:YD repeat-containing protein